MFNFQTDASTIFEHQSSTHVAVLSPGYLVMIPCFETWRGKFLLWPRGELDAYLALLYQLVPVPWYSVAYVHAVAHWFAPILRVCVSGAAAAQRKPRSEAKHQQAAPTELRRGLFEIGNGPCRAHQGRQAAEPEK